MNGARACEVLVEIIIVLRAFERNQVEGISRQETGTGRYLYAVELCSPPHNKIRGTVQNLAEAKRRDSVIETPISVQLHCCVTREQGANATSRPSTANLLLIMAIMLSFQRRLKFTDHIWNFRPCKTCRLWLLSCIELLFQQSLQGAVEVLARIRSVQARSKLTELASSTLSTSITFNML